MQIIHDQTAQDLLGDAATTLSPKVIRTLTDCVTMLNDEGRVMQLSRAYLDMLDVDDEDHLIGNLWWQIWPESAQAALQEAVARGFSGHITQYWTHYEHADGSITEWDIRLTPLYDASKCIKSVIAVSRNMTTH